MNPLAEQCAIIHEFLRLTSRDGIQLEKLFFSLIDTLAVCLEQSHIWLIDSRERRRAFELIRQVESIHHQSRAFVSPMLLGISFAFTNELKQSVAQYEYQSFVTQEIYLHELKAILKEMQHVFIDPKFKVLIDFYSLVLENHFNDFEKLFSRLFPVMKLVLTSFYRKFQANMDNSEETQHILVLITKLYNRICQFKKRENDLPSSEILISKDVRMDVLYEILTKIVRIIHALKFQENAQQISVNEQCFLDLIANVLQMMASSEHHWSQRISYNRTIKAFMTLLEIEHSNSDMTFDGVYDLNRFIRRVLVHLNIIFEHLLLPDDTKFNDKLFLYNTRLEQIASAFLPPSQESEQTLFNTETDDESCELLQATTCVTGMEILKKYGLIIT